MDEIVYTRADGIPAARFEFPDSIDIESLAVTYIEPGLYRLDETPVFSDFARYGDIVEADEAPDGLLVCRRVAARSGLLTLSFMVDKDFVTSDAWTRFKERIMAVGGNWEQVFGGIIMLHYPEGTEIDLERLLREASQEARDGSA